MTKTKFDKKKLTNFKKQIISNKTKRLAAEKKLDGLITKYYNFFLGRNYFASNDGSQNMFVYQPIFNVLELKIGKCNEFVIGWKSNGLYNSNL